MEELTLKEKIEQLSQGKVRRISFLMRALGYSETPTEEEMDEFMLAYNEVVAEIQAPK